MSSLPVWTDENQKAFTHVVIEETRRLGRTESGFKKATCSRMQNMFSERAATPYSKAHMQIKPQQLKKKHGIFSSILHKSTRQWLGASHRAKSDPTSERHGIPESRIPVPCAKWASGKSGNSDIEAVALRFVFCDVNAANSATVA
jgi:hypothetical protein